MCAGFVEAANGNHVLLQGRDRTWWQARFQTNHPALFLLQGAAPCHEPTTAPAPNQQSGHQPAPGPGWELEKSFWFQQALEQIPWWGAVLFWLVKLLTSLPLALGAAGWELFASRKQPLKTNG